MKNNCELQQEKNFLLDLKIKFCSIDKNQNAMIKSSPLPLLNKKKILIFSVSFIALTSRILLLGPSETREEGEIIYEKFCLPRK